MPLKKQTKPVSDQLDWKSKPRRFTTSVIRYGSAPWAHRLPVIERVPCRPTFIFKPSTICKLVTFLAGYYYSLK